jgi:RNA polymerase sigma factor (sigma-70 family)
MVDELDQLTTKDNPIIIAKLQDETLDEEERWFYEDILLDINGGMIFKIAQRYFKHATSSFAEEDIHQSAKIIALTLAKKFNLNSGNKFSTYLYSSMPGRIMHDIMNKSAVIRVPINTQSELISLHKFEDKFYDEHLRKPTNDEILANYKITERRLKDLNEIRFHDRNVLSMDIDYSDGDDLTLISLIEDPFADTQQAAFDKELIKILNERMNILNERERYTLEYYYGLDGRKRKTLREIGKEFGISAVTAGIALHRAENKLKSPTTMCLLSPFRKEAPNPFDATFEEMKAEEVEMRRERRLKRKAEALLATVS